MKKNKLKITIADTTDTHETRLAPREGDDGYGDDYVPPTNPPVVDKCIEILNGLCRKYKYAVLMDHDVVSEDELEFFIDYRFNGKELGVIRIVMDASSHGKWTARCYLSVKKASRLPITNLAMFIADFKRLIQNLHIIVGEKTI